MTPEPPGAIVCVFRGNPAGYSDGKRPPFRAKPATHSDGKAATFRPVVGKVAGIVGIRKSDTPLKFARELAIYFRNNPGITDNQIPAYWSMDLKELREIRKKMVSS